jgi:isopenicillin N synthase-like dioxygenase
MEQGMRASRQFFALHSAVKNKYGYQGHASNRGYIGVGLESHQDFAAVDTKETFDIGKEGELDLETPWPRELPDEVFKHNLLAYFNAFDRLHLRLLRLIAIGLGLDDENFFVNRCNEQHCNLRLLHYPEMKLDQQQVEKDKVIVRGARHTDFGTLTLLVQDSVGGLRVENQDGQWVNVQPIENSIVVNVGDMLQRWTGGVLRATPHQVIQPFASDDEVDNSLVKTIPERYSIAFFCNANKTILLESLKLIGACTYEPINALDYLTQRLNETISSADKAKA